MPDHVTWAGVVYSLIVAMPATIAAVTALLNRRALVTGNNKTVGEMVTEQHGVLSREAVTYGQHDEPNTRSPNESA